VAPEELGEVEFDVADMTGMGWWPGEVQLVTTRLAARYVDVAPKGLTLPIRVITSLR